MSPTSDPLTVQILDGFPDRLGELAERNGGARSFLRAAWYRAAAGRNGRTILAMRADGSPVAAIPIARKHRSIASIQSVPGSYWPFRSILLDLESTDGELSELFTRPEVRSTLGAMWRVGPVYRDDPVVSNLKRAVSDAGWTVLTRPLGCTYILPLAALARQGDWPRKSTLRRLKNYGRQLERQGKVAYRQMNGSDWDEAGFQALAQIEAKSWIGSRTDGKGAKFLREEQRDYWRRVTRDPAIAESLSATILTLDDRPIAFTFDLRVDEMQYSIGSSFDEDYAAARPGKMVTYYQLQQAVADGIETVDMGAGDSGYKREMGAVPGTEIIDLLIVRNRPMAQLVQVKWGAESELGRQCYRPAEMGRTDLMRYIRPVLAAGAIAATAVAVAE